MKFLDLYFKLLFTITCVVPTWAATSALHLIDPVISDPTATSFNITVEIEKYEQKLRFHLETNQDLIPPDAEIYYSEFQGETKEKNKLSDSKLQFTRGSVWTRHTPGNGWQNVGWARLAVSQGDTILLDGTFSLTHVQYKIQLENDGNGSTRMIAHEVESFSPFANRSSTHPICSVAPGHSRSKRQGWNPWGNNALIANIGNTYGCPDTRQIAYIGIMTDCTFTASFNSSDAARRYILNMVNTASVVFESSFNISLSIRNLTLSDAECPTSGSSTTTEWNMPCSQGDLNSRLRDFSTWRGATRDSNAYWTLLTGCSVAAGEVGVSWVGALCSSGSGYSSGQAGANVVALTQTEWQVFAHESAHTFGAVHDCDYGTCGTGTGGNHCCPLSSSTCDTGGQYIMDPITQSGMTRFSPCTIGNVCAQLGSGDVDGRCLVDSHTGNTTGSNGQCGNGIVEPGEACDCGNGACNDHDTECCDSLTCQWRGDDRCNRSTPRPGNDGGRQGESNGGTRSWAQNHLSLIIGIAAGVGGGLLLLVLGCMIWSCMPRRRPKAVIKNPATT